MNVKVLMRLLLILLTVSLSNQISGQTQSNMKLKKVMYEVEVNASPQEAWEVLASYGDVGDFHSGVQSSNALNGSSNQACIGADRICHLVDGKRKIMVKEKILDFKKGAFYQYDVYEWKNFPLKKMLNTFGVKVNPQGKTVIYQITEYKLKPSFLTGLMKGKIENSARDGVLAYKHYIETGEKNADMAIIHNKYKSF